MDKVDNKILVELIQDSRQSITQIAKKTRLSREVVTYRIEQLQDKDIIRNFITEINQEKLGFQAAVLFVSLKAEIEEEFIAFINKQNFISWAATQLGQWSLGMAIYGRNTHEIGERFQTIYEKYKEYISKHEFAFYKQTEIYTEKYFGEKRISVAKKDIPCKIDEHDKTILRHLSNNARITSVELAQDIPLTPVAITQRMRKLEKANYIKGYSLYINVLKLDLYLFLFFMQNKNLEQRKKLFAYLQAHPKVTLLVDYIGDPYLEFGIFVKNPYETREILQEIKNSFPDNEVVDFFLTQEDFISSGLPSCVFD